MPAYVAFVAALFVLFSSTPSLAYDLGEITEVRGSTLRFFRGDEVVSVDERLQVFNSAGKPSVLIRVTNLDEQMASAQVIGVQVSNGFFETWLVGQKVHLQIDLTKFSSGSFFAGPNFSATVGEFGGTNYTLGLRYLRPLRENLRLSVVVEADDLGKDSLGIGKRKADYMVGVGYVLGPVVALAHVGAVDIMTIPKDGSTQTIRDPYGGSYPAGVTHTWHVGYLAGVQFPIIIGKPSRTSNEGWGLTPGVSIAGQLGDANYGPIVATYLSIDWLFL